MDRYFHIFSGLEDNTGMSFMAVYTTIPTFLNILTEIVIKILTGDGWIGNLKIYYYLAEDDRISSKVSKFPIGVLYFSLPILMLLLSLAILSTVKWQFRRSVL